MWYKSFASFLLFLLSLFVVIALPTFRIAIVVFSLIRSEYRKESMNQCTKPKQINEAKRLRATTFTIAKKGEQ